MFSHQHYTMYIMYINLLTYMLFHTQHSYHLTLTRGSMHLVINICVPKREVSYDVPLHRYLHLEHLSIRAWQQFVWLISNWAFPKI